MTEQSDAYLSDPMARRVWDAYFREVDKRLRPLVAPRRREIRDELVAHVLDGLDAETDGSEAARLDRVLGRMGSPGDYLGRLAGDDDLATDTSPGWRAGRGALALGRSIALGGCYLLGLLALLLAVAKPFWPNEVGLFRMPSGWYVAGFVDSSGAVELLGNWLIPLMLMLVGLFWYLLPRRLGQRRG